MRSAVFTSVALAVLAACTAMFLTGGWYLECRDPAGNPLGGIDCFQYGGGATAANAPARWFDPALLGIAWGAALVTLLLVAHSRWLRRSERRSGLTTGPAG